MQKCLQFNTIYYFSWCTGLPECDDFKINNKCWSAWNWGNESDAKVIHSISISITGLHLPIQIFLISVTISIFIRLTQSEFIHKVCITIIYTRAYTRVHTHTCARTHRHMNRHTNTQEESAPFTPTPTGVIHHGAGLPVPYVQCRP